VRSDFKREGVSFKFENLANAKPNLIHLYGNNRKTRWVLLMKNKGEKVCETILELLCTKELKKGKN
jgi:hypothetical protein